ncbi:AAA family ATPase [Acinetobacter indicus]|uniref:AAA family ATPase n=1 Tax=Acinetobacter indicus TaxID=756892 RepID=UPI00126646E7|nr:AAA family ATPase [Acinetobacter indicus]QFS17057.1 AAA family ATPase [Acinetobacter indicus]
MNAKITLNAPLAVSTDPVTGNTTEYHSIEDFIKGCIDEQHFKVKPESYIYSKLPDYNCEECEALPLVNPNELTEVIGYGIRGIAKKYDTSQTPCKEIDSQKVSFSIGKAGIFASNTNNKYMSYVLGTDNIDLFVQLAKAGEAVVLHKDIDAAYQIINNGMPESIFRLIAGKSAPKDNADLFVQLDDSFKEFTKADIKKLFLEKVNQLKQSIDPESFIQPPAEEKPLLDQQVDKGQVSLQIVNMATIQAQAINWLWSGWLPLGKLTILAGAGGCGKTNLLLALIATITTNGIFPDGSKCTDTGKVLIYSTEDDPNDTLLPRLIANGADLSKIDFIAGRINDKGEREPFDPTKDLPLLNAYAKQNPDIKLLMIDPIISAVGGDSNKATDVRRSLQVVVDFAQEFNCAVVGITHFAKGTSGSSPAERIIGSQAFTALARMVWSAAKREDENDCILVRAKSNISTLDGGIKYQIEPETVLENIETTKTAWLGTIEGSARELLSEAESTENSNGTTVDMAKEFLIDLLSSVENMPSKEVQSQAKDAGFSPASIRRAQEKLNIKPFKPQGEKIWFWSLPKIHRLDEPTHF